MALKQKTQLKAAFSLAYLDYEKGLNSYVSRKINDVAIGKDLVQDTFVKTWSYILGGGRLW